MGNVGSALDVILLGPVGSGKGTQARLISEEHHIPHVASGELLRAHRQQGTPLGREAQSYMDRGALVPDKLVIEMIMHRMHEPDAVGGVLLDGFPRTLAQAEALDAELHGNGRSVQLAIYLRVPTEALVDRASTRLTCRVCQATYNTTSNPPRVPGVCDVCGGELYQREDDRESVVRERIQVYLRDTVPVVEYYRRKGMLEEVDGTLSIPEVAVEVRRRIARAMAA